MQVYVYGRLLSMFVLLVLAVCPFLEAKVLRGTVNSVQAWKERGQFVSKFCFHDKKALFKFTINGTSSGRWYFFLDESWGYAYREPDCSKKLAMAKFDMPLDSTMGQQYVNQWVRPHFWFLVYADPNTCGPTPPETYEVVQYEVTFLNPDSKGEATDHFGDDLGGLRTFYLLLVLVYVGGIGAYAHRVWLTISKGGPMHEVLKMLSVAMAIHFSAAVLMLIHLWRYSVNGEGVPLFETLSEVAEMLAQCHVIWMLLSMSLGWTLGSSTAHPVRDRRQLYTITGVALVHFVLVLWEQSYDENHYTYHIHESLPGLLLTLFRVALSVLFGYNLQKTMSTERSALRLDFYQSFAIGCFLWFLSFPLLMLFAMIFAEYLRHKVVTVGVTIVQTCAMVLLSRLFLSRSLYWEVSTLSSTTLPLRRDRGGGTGFLTSLS